MLTKRLNHAFLCHKGKAFNSESVLPIDSSELESQCFSPLLSELNGGLRPLDPTGLLKDTVDQAEDCAYACV